jgi:cbb3-type cytochrome oxidase subunit 3
MQYLQGIALLYLTLMFMASAALMIVAPQSWIDKINKEHPEYEMTKFSKLYPLLDVCHILKFANDLEFRCIFALGALSIGLGMALIGIFYAIVYRAYKNLKAGHDDNQKLLNEKI